MEPKSKRGADVLILIPKQLRLDWIDCLALDRELSHVAFRAACVIGTHLNNRSGLTFLGLPHLAELLGCSDRTAWQAVQQLEKEGYLLIEHRRGKGHANEYKPAIDGERATVKSAAAKLAAHCELSKVQNSQKRASKLAANCDPTLNPLTGVTPTRRRAHARGAGAAGASRTVFVAKSDEQWSSLAERWRHENGKQSGPPPTTSTDHGNALGWWFPVEWVAELSVEQAVARATG